MVNKALTLQMDSGAMALRVVLRHMCAVALRVRVLARGPFLTPPPSVFRFFLYLKILNETLQMHFREKQLVIRTTYPHSRKRILIFLPSYGW